MNILQANEQKRQDFSQYLLFENDNYISQLEQDNLIKLHNDKINKNKHNQKIKKQSITPWNQGSDDVELSTTPNLLEPKYQYHHTTPQNRIEMFLSTIQSKFNQNGFRSKLHRKDKKFNFYNINMNNHNNNNDKYQLDNTTSVNYTKDEIFLPLNNTVIMFPKSKSQPRRLDNEEKMILEKIYKKRQKSKIIPKQISIANLSQIDKKNHQTLEKNKERDNQIGMNNKMTRVKRSLNVVNFQKIYNPEMCNTLIVKDIQSNKKMSFSSNKDNKTVSTNFQKRMQTKNHQFLRNLRNSKGIRKLNSLNDQNQLINPSRLYKTLYSSPKLSNFDELSISKIKQDAKCSHLNRIKNERESQMQLLGSTIAHWKKNAEKKLKKQQTNHNNSLINTLT